MPIRGADHARTNAGACLGGLYIRSNGTAFFVDTGGPIEFLGETPGGKKCAIGAIENVQKAVSVRFDDEFSRLTAETLHRPRREFPPRRNRRDRAA